MVIINTAASQQGASVVTILCETAPPFVTVWLRQVRHVTAAVVESCMCMSAGVCVCVFVLTPAKERGQAPAQRVDPDSRKDDKGPFP